MRSLFVLGGLVSALVLILLLTLAPSPPGQSPPGVALAHGAPDARSVVVTAPSAAAQKVMAANGGQRPNVVMVMMDDMRADEWRFLPRTKQYISQRGLIFRNAFSPYPLCCPARSSFLKGQYPHNHGVLYISNPYAFGAIDDRETIGSRMHDAGYHTALVGKYLNRYGINRSRVTGKPSVHYRPNGWTDWAAALDPFWHDGTNHGGSVYDYFHFTQNINGKIVHNRGEYSAHVVARQAQYLISKYHRSAAPFFMFLTPPAPHNGSPHEADDPGYATTSRGLRYELGTPARPGWVKGRFNRAIPKALGLRKNGHSEVDISDKQHLMRAWPEPTATEARGVRTIERQRAEALYAWDVQFGQIVKRLKETGELAHTVLMFTSDNGYFNGEHRQRQGKIWAHEESLHVPFAVAGPGIERGVRYVPLTIADMTATILDIGRARPLPRMDSQSRLAQMVGGDRSWDVPMVTEGLIKHIDRTLTGFPRVLTTSGIRTGRYKLIRYSDQSAELYDLVRDPNELHNVYQNPNYRTIRNRLLVLWEKVRTCSGAACRQALPADLVFTPAKMHRLNSVALEARHAYYG